MSKYFKILFGQNVFYLLTKFTIHRLCSKDVEGHPCIFFGSYKYALGGLRAIEAGEIEALIFDAPILRYLIHHELKGGLEVLPHTFHREDYGIALPKGSSLREPINRVLLQKIRGREWQDSLHHYLGGSFDLNSSQMPQ